MSPDNTKREDHWLARPATTKLLWTVFTVALVIVVLCDFAVDHHPFFGLDDTFGFGAWIGFGACAVLIFGAGALGAVLKRPDTYYDN